MAGGAVPSSNAVVPPSRIYPISLRRGCRIALSCIGALRDVWCAIPHRDCRMESWYQETWISILALLPTGCMSMSKQLSLASRVLGLHLLFEKDMLAIFGGLFISRVLWPNQCILLKFTIAISWLCFELSA